MQSILSYNILYITKETKIVKSKLLITLVTIFNKGLYNVNLAYKSLLCKFNILYLTYNVFYKS